MRRVTLACALAFLMASTMSSAVHAQWKQSNSVDELDDSKISRAWARYSDGHKYLTAVVQCTNDRLVSYIDFDEFLGTDSRPVTYRFDQQAPKKEEWWISADGTAVLTLEAAEFSRALSRGNQLIIEVLDYRFVPHRAKFSLAGSQQAIKRVLEDCNTGTVAVYERVPNLNPSVSLEVERWGPQYVLHSKESLRHMGYFDGPMDNQKSDAFYLAVDKLYRDYLTQCDAGQVEDTYCWSYQLSKRRSEEYGDSDVRYPAPSSILYQVSAKPFKAMLGKLNYRD